jgi:hypothetical protein
MLVFPKAVPAVTGTVTADMLPIEVNSNTRLLIALINPGLEHFGKSSFVSAVLRAESRR